MLLFPKNVIEVGYVARAWKDDKEKRDTETITSINVEVVVQKLPSPKNDRNVVEQEEITWIDRYNFVVDNRLSLALTASHPSIHPSSSQNECVQVRSIEL